MAERREPSAPAGASATAAPLALTAVTTAALLALGGTAPAATSFVLCALGATLSFVVLTQRRDWLAIARGSAVAAAAVLGLPLLTAIQAAVLVVYPFSGGPPMATVQSCVLLIAYLLFFLCAAASARSSRQARIIVLGLFAIGFAEALYGSLNLLAGNQTLLIFKRWAYFDSATGTLVNRNHFAYLLEMTIPLGFLVASTATAVAKRPDETRSGHTEDGARRTLLAVPVAVMLLALALSRSRMGLASLVGAAFVVWLLDRILRPQSDRGRSLAGGRATTLVVAGMAIFLLFGVGVDVAFERFSRAPGDLEVGRLPVWADTWRMFLAHPLLGNGMGSFEYLNASFREGPTGFYVTHAHSDYLEVLAESGIAGLAIVATWVVLFVRRLMRALRTPLEPIRRSYVLASAIGILSVIFHSSADFGLRVPGVTLTLLLLVAVFLNASAGTDLQATAPRR